MIIVTVLHIINVKFIQYDDFQKSEFWQQFATLSLDPGLAKKSKF